VTPVNELLDAENHFGHRESDGLAVDLFWSRDDVKHEFRVEVEDKLVGVRLFLYPASGKEAMHAFHHPFAAAAELGSSAWAA
jgi:hypothetical protein